MLSALPKSGVRVGLLNLYPFRYAVFAMKKPCIARLGFTEIAEHKPVVRFPLTMGISSSFMITKWCRTHSWAWIRPTLMDGV
jgi:hypothetical protein